MNPPKSKTLATKLNMRTREAIEFLRRTAAPSPSLSRLV